MVSITHYVDLTVDICSRGFWTFVMSFACYMYNLTFASIYEQKQFRNIIMRAITM